LPPALADAILAEARAAHPRECCGLLEGRRQGDAVIVHALHPARNLSAAVDRFEMDPRDQFAAQRHARANGRMVVGCYHSHPGGMAAPSAADRAGGGEQDFVWAIAGTDGLKIYVYADGVFLATGADWVTSSP
jgi:proteasome lid subunit RPN8/RPN11